VVALLEGRKPPSQMGRAASSHRAASPAGVAASPVRSMLDVGNSMPNVGRHASIAGTTMGITSPNSSMFSQAPRVRSMLDTSSPPPTPGLASRNHRASHGSTSPPAPPPGRGTGNPKMNPEDVYNFEMLPSIQSQSMPKRVTQGGKKKPGAMAAIFGSADNGKRPEARHGSLITRSNKSVSPAPGRLSGRSQSPAARKLNNNGMNLLNNPNTYVSDSGQVIDLASAYRRLSDAALLKSGGRLANLPTRKDVNLSKGEQLAPDGGVRLTKDFNEEDAIDSSEDESGSSDEEWNVDSRRGRGRTRHGSGSQDDDRPLPKSLLGAAEEERKRITQHTNYAIAMLTCHIRQNGELSSTLSLGPRAICHSYWPWR
jgi:hypothetical protein